MRLPPELAAERFDADAFERLCRALQRKELAPERNRMPAPPAQLRDTPDVMLRDVRIAGAQAEEDLVRGRAALREGRVAALVLNGGMATRFGGGAKGVVPVVAGRSETFLSTKLASIRHAARDAGGTIPVAFMHSFATRDASVAELERVDWLGQPDDARLDFSQSVMPRVSLEGEVLHALDGSHEVPLTTTFCAPGHGDTLDSVRLSGVAARLRELGVEHVLVSNVDNLGASPDPRHVGAHLRAVDEGAQLSVEVVQREGDAGGCIAGVEGRAVIVEGFRLPEGTDLDRYPEFNTNTLWFTIDALERELPLTWFCVQRSVEWAGGVSRPVIQFERLIGQATEFVPSAYMIVDRQRRFLPIKTRVDLERAEARMRDMVARWFA